MKTNCLYCSASKVSLECLQLTTNNLPQKSFVSPITIYRLRQKLAIRQMFCQPQKAVFKFLTDRCKLVL